MNGMAQVSYRKLLFFRSCLESSPANLEPKLFAPFLARRPGDRTHSQLHQLKRKLVRAAPEETPETVSFKRLCGAANQAVKLAWATSYPLLVFPCLFDEMVRAVRERFPLAPVPHLPPNLSEFVIRNARPTTVSPALNWNELATHPEYDGRARIQDDASVHERSIASVEK